jgi:hypothetical protein
MTKLSEKKGGGSADEGEKGDLLQTYDERVELDVDLRLTVNEVKERLLECCSLCLIDLGLQNNSSGTYSQSTTNRNMVVLSALDKFGDGYHPQMPLAGMYTYTYIHLFIYAFT